MRWAARSSQNIGTNSALFWDVQDWCDKLYHQVSAQRKSVAIVQSSYVPWKGYFDLIRSVDEFVLYDDQQFTRRDWRNRNRIKTPQGTIWLTIPVNVKGRYHQRIDETTISDPGWAERTAGAYMAGDAAGSPYSLHDPE